MSPLPKKRHKTSQHSSNARFKYFKFIVHKARVLETTSNDVKSSTTRRLEYDEGEATVSTEGGEGDSQNISYTDTTRKTTTNTSKASPKKTRTKQHRHHTHKNPRGKDKQRDRTSKRPYFPQKGEDTEEEQVDDRQHHYYVVATDWNSYRHQSHVVVVGSMFSVDTLSNRTQSKKRKWSGIFRSELRRSGADTKSSLRSALTDT